MQSLKEVIYQAHEGRYAIGHFNISNLEGLNAIFSAAKNLGVPVVIGVSEGERDFMGVPQVRALVSSIAKSFEYPIYLNADHTYSLERVKEVVDAGFDSVIIDGANLPMEENIALTKSAVEYAKSVNPGILVEAEVGYIGSGSTMLDGLPEGVDLSIEAMPKPEEVADFVRTTGVDLISPAVGNIHGMLKGMPNPKLHIDLIRRMREQVPVPLVLHGGSGIADDNFIEAIDNGISMIHINTELRKAFRQALDVVMREKPDEVAPYKLMKPTVEAMEQLVTDRLRLFGRGRVGNQS